MTEYAETFLLIVVLIIAVAVHILLSDRKKQAIRREIRRLGGDIIEISENYFDNDKQTYTYDVVFADLLGKKFRTSCKIKLYGTKLYWTRSPAQLMNREQPSFNTHYGNEELRQQKTGGAMAESSKDQIIDQLYAENQQLRRDLEQLRKTRNTNKE